MAVDYKSLVSKADGVKHLYKSNGNTDDIIAAILFADKLSAPYFKNLTPVLAGKDLKTTCYNFWKFLKENVAYKEDEDGTQNIQSPGYTVERGFCDCKSFSVALASFLQNAGIKYFYRFISETNGKDFHHVYVVVPTPDGDILLDCVLDEFNRENAYATKRDIVPESVRNMPRRAQIGKIGATQAQAYAASWMDADKLYKNNISYIYDRIKADGINDIESNTHWGSIVRHKLKKAWNDNFDVFITSALCMVYLHWDNTKCAPPNATNYDRFDGDFVVKQHEGEAYRNNLRDLRLSDNVIDRLTALACYKTYGITLGHMLDRCYCMLLFGQPWRAAPGVPYYDFQTRVFHNTGTSPESLAMTFRIMMCFPAGGGITRPYGQPYISVAGWYIPNGASKSVYDTYKANYVWSLTEKEHILTQYNGAPIDANIFAQCYADYNQWLGGNLPALPALAINTGTGAPHIGTVGLAEIGIIVAIIGAVIGALSTIAGIVMAIINAVHHHPDAAHLANPPADFKMEFQTVDNCYIGTAPAECGALKAKYCPDGTFTCLTAADLALPGNQPGTLGGNGFLGGKGNLFLLLAGGALLLFGLMSGGKKSNA